MDKSLQSAKLYVELDDTEKKIDNEILPLMAYVNQGSAQLAEAAQAFSNEIKKFKKDFRLVVEKDRN